MTDYLDYLPDTPYEALPDAVKATITAADYGIKQSLARELAVLGHNETGLPAVLRQAHSAKHSRGNPKAVITGAALPRRMAGGTYRSAFRWAAAACVLLAATTLALLLREPKEKLIYQVVSAEIPPPSIVYDTIYQESLVEKTVYLTRIDTLKIFTPEKPRFVYLTDTVYLEKPTLLPAFVQSKTAAEEVGLLDLLAPAN